MTLVTTSGVGDHRQHTRSPRGHALPPPTLIVVSGPPGSGKTSLAHALAQAIPCPAICRDELKEGMVHAQGGEFQGAHGDPLTQRTVPLFLDVLRVLLTAGVTVVAEAAFQDPLWRRGLEPLAELAQLRIVHCNVDAAVSFERAARRSSANESRRRAHGDSTLGKQIEDWTRTFASFDRISIPAPSIDVDTTDGYAPDLAEIVDFVNRI
jgi:predicted kinase